MEKQKQTKGADLLKFFITYTYIYPIGSDQIVSERKIAYEKKTDSRLHFRKTLLSIFCPLRWGLAFASLGKSSSRSHLLYFYRETREQSYSVQFEAEKRERPRKADAFHGRFSIDIVGIVPLRSKAPDQHGLPCAVSVHGRQ